MKKCSRGYIKQNQSCVFKSLSLKNGIDHSDMIKTLSYYKEPYYDKYIDYIKNHNIEFKLKPNELNIMIAYLSRKKCYLGISFEKPNCIYRKLNLTDLQLKNFHYCLISNGFTVNSLQNVLYCCCSDVNIDFPIKSPDSNISSIVQLFGIEQINLLNYINVDRIHYFSNTKEGIHSTNELKKYQDIMKSYSCYLQSKSIIMSSMMLYVIGTTTAMDVDIIISNRYHETDQLIDELNENGIDVKMLRNDNHWEEHGKIINWMKKSFSNDWVKQSGHHEINDFFMNSKCFFYLHGLKFVSLDIQIQRLIKRNSINSYVDLLAIHLNHLSITPLPCIYPLLFRQGKVDIIDPTLYHSMIQQIKKKLKEWQNISLSFDDIQHLLPYCNIKRHSNLDHFYQYLNNIIKLYKETYPHSYTSLFTVKDIPSNTPFIILHTINLPFLTKSIHIKSFSIHKDKHIDVVLNNQHYTVPKTIDLPGYILYEKTKLLEHYDNTLDLDEMNIARLFITYVYQQNLI